jgi:hypothetical protein
MTRRVVPTFAEVLPTFLKDMLAGPGLVQFLVLAFVLWVFSWLPFVGKLLYILCLPAYLLHVVRESAKGAETLPGVPDLDDVYSDMIFPAIRFIVASLMLWVPAVIYLFWYIGLRTLLEEPLTALTDPTLALIIIASVILYPAMFMAAAIGRSFAAMFNPVVLFGVILRLPGQYFLVVGIWALLGLVNAGMVVTIFLLDAVIHIPVVSGLLSQAVALVIPITVSFLFGRFVYQNAVALGHMTEEEFKVPEYPGAKPRVTWPLVPPAPAAETALEQDIEPLELTLSDEST